MLVGVLREVELVLASGVFGVEVREEEEKGAVGALDARGEVCLG